MLNLTNYFDHPGDNRYTVYRFILDEHADYFEALLVQHGITYERFLDTEAENRVILFGVNKRFQKEALRMNFLTHGHFRKPFIGNAWVKWLMLLITTAAIVLAVAGFILSN